MWKLTITDTHKDTAEQATVKGREIVDGPSPDALSIAMSDTIDLLYQFKNPNTIMDMFQEASAPRWTLELEHI